MNESAPARPAVVVVGGGYGGINVAKPLDDVADVILVEPRDAFVHNVAALRALAGPSWLPRIYLPCGNLLRRGRVLRDRVVKAGPGQVTLGHPLRQTRPRPGAARRRASRRVQLPESGTAWRPTDGNEAGNVA